MTFWDCIEIMKTEIDVSEGWYDMLYVVIIFVHVVVISMGLLLSFGRLLSIKESPIE